MGNNRPSQVLGGEQIPKCHAKLIFRYMSMYNSLVHFWPLSKAMERTQQAIATEAAIAVLVNLLALIWNDQQHFGEALVH